MNRTLTREEIENHIAEMKQYQNELIVGGDVYPEEAEFIIALCNMALNSIPKAFDVEDETTWPELQGWYLAWSNKWDVNTVFVDSDIFAGFTEDITHYMPIPEVGESK